MFAIERSDGDLFAADIEINGYDRQQIAYHAVLLSDAGYIDGQDRSSLASRNFHIRRLTNQGHDFLDAIRDQTVWGNTKNKVLEHGGSIALGLVKEIATAYLRQKIGI